MRSAVRVYNDGESEQQIIFCAVEDIKFVLKGNTLSYKRVKKSGRGIHQAKYYAERSKSLQRRRK